MNSKKDKLTGLFNRDWAEVYIDISMKQGLNVSAAVMDIDFYTNINEKIGYSEGDETLIRISETIEGTLTDNMYLARYGSDEFIIIFIQHNQEFIDSYASELKKTFKMSRFIKAAPYDKVRITFSMGISVSDTENINTPFKLLKSAETALFTAKKKGRNRIEIYNGIPLKILRYGKCCTLAGNSLKGDSDDGQESYCASVSEPYGLCIYPDGGIIFADRSNHKIKKIHNGKIYTIAGTGSPDYCGDGLNPKFASLNKPSGVCVDKNGILYIADTGNHCIRMIKDGVITTLAGCGRCGYTGDGGPAKMGNLNRPGGVACDDNGNVYTNDYGNNVIRKIDKNGRISTVAGSGEYGSDGDGGLAVESNLDRPYGLCVTSDGKNLYIADYGTNKIRHVDMENNIISTLCGTGSPGFSGDGGDCKSAELHAPYWVCENNGSLYIADAENNRIRYIDLRTKIIQTLIGEDAAGFVDSSDSLTGARLNMPAGICFDSDCMYIADYGNNAIRKVKLQ